MSAIVYTQFKKRMNEVIEAALHLVKLCTLHVLMGGILQLCQIPQPCYFKNQIKAF